MPVKISLCVDRRADGAGDMEDVVRDLDLCPECAGEAFRIADSQWKPSHDQREALYKALIRRNR